VPSAPRPRLRFVIESSYWVYLLHLPLVQLLQIAFGRLPWPAPAKYALVLAITFGVTMGSFAWWVRGTALGEWLGAKRRPAGASALG
jgi:peptidoglycan/LPS O-acetylase OafA/YrhL